MAAGRALRLDNLRIALITGVIVAHVATAYVVDVDWYYQERTTRQWASTVLSFPVLLAGVFGLGPSFLVAGAPRQRATSQVLRVGRLALAAGLIAVGSWVTWLHWTYTSDIVVNLNLAHWPQDAVLFALGALAGERGWLDTLTHERARRWGWVAAGGVLAVAVVAGVALAVDDIDAMYGGVHWQAATFAVAAGVVAVTLPLWLVELFKRHWDHQGHLAERASRGCYAA